ncbi:hypothetical protein [Oleiagrimonas sp. MCCC 1A03011]|uniref:hypothetical protein n=1 Tax=Oleiagrimonas sp. MCCC 1A03011 TaxID=1926883 RepID=UPI0011BDE15F|nr:hypothetical protein [Oleiagrimonas sp. MCCC 1A03011]
MSVNASIKQGLCVSVGYSRTAKWISILSMIAFIVFTCGIHTAIAKESNIDFSKSQYFLALDQCPHPEPGWVYVKIAGVDLRMPYDSSIGLWGYKYRTQVGGKGTEGCRGHPVPLQTLFLYPYRDRLLADWPASARNGLKGFDLYDSILPRWPQANSEKSLSEMRSEHQCHDIGNGLYRCAVSPVTPTTPLAFAVSQLIYKTPDKHVFTVNCGALAGPPGGGIYNYECGVAYSLSPRLILEYKFDRRKVNIKDIVELDHSLRKSVRLFILKD